jgi:UDP-N-acetylmuramoylalanine-D-glutamate ligase
MTPLTIAAVTGTTGKTTTARLLDQVLRAAGWRTVTWLDEGVAIDGTVQPGELLPWQRGLARLARGDLQAAIQELPAATVQAVGLPAGAYRLGIVTNLAHNDPVYAATPRAANQAIANGMLVAAVHPAGTVVLNADDHAVADLGARSAAPVTLWALRRGSPALARHLRAGGRGLYLEEGRIVVAEAGQSMEIGAVSAAPVTLAGAALPQVQDLLAALAGGLALGLTPPVLERGLATLEIWPHLLERTIRLEGGVPCRLVAATVGSLPAARGMARLMRRWAPRQTRVIGAVGWPAGLSEAEARELARLLANLYGLLFVHGPEADRAVELIREARPAGRLPTFCVPAASEAKAVRRLLHLAAIGDAVLLLSPSLPALAALLPDA